MKRFKILLLLLSMALYSAGQIPKGKKKNTKIDSAGVFPNGGQEGATKNVELAKGNDILLVYTGNLSGFVNIDIGVHIEIDSLIGVRYEVVYERGSGVLTHTASFYKFSDPKRSVFYDFRTHDSTVTGCCGSSSNEPKVKVVGIETIDSFSCTHLQTFNNSDRTTTDFWVSKSVPGYLKLINILNNINPNMPGLFINGTIFQWGGLVKMRGFYTDPKTGKTTNVNLQLAEANSTMGFPASDFDVPSK